VNQEAGGNGTASGEGGSVNRAPAKRSSHSEPELVEYELFALVRTGVLFRLEVESNLALVLAPRDPRGFLLDEVELALVGVGEVVVLAGVL